MRTSRIFLLLGTATALGCGAAAVPPASEATAQAPPKTGSEPIKAPANPGAVPVAKAGDYVTVKGQVTWPGAMPKLVAIPPVGAAVGCCPANVPLLPTDILVDPKSKGLQNVVVWVRPDTENRKDTFPQDKIHPDLLKPKSKEHVIDQPLCQFEPRILVARAGDTLTVKNSSALPHNVNYDSDIETMNPIIQAGGSVKLMKPFAAQTSPITLACNIHPWMAGRIRVFDHPYFAITDKDGNFEIKNLPAGKWRLVYWHELGLHKGKEGVLGFPVDAKADKPGGTTMEMKPLGYEPPPK